MTLQEFIEDNREELDRCIRGACPNIGPIDDDERELWIANDEGLYNWARSAGVDL